VGGRRGHHRDGMNLIIIDGVHITPAVPWRWDDALERLV
jgi:hypothetical protein